ncbi:MAG TPA: D-alanyl-D-alanine carboxypeptidase family protein [Solirubrobacteraceae bacterium]|jgi:LAS superfamily LD-carboxypeptidase LdcB
MTIHRTQIRRRRVAGLLEAVALLAVLGGQWPAASSPTAPAPAREHRLPPSAPPHPLGEADGAVPDGTTVFDDRVPGVARLDPALLAALRRAAADAAGEGVTLLVDSGWRSRAYQRHLLDEATAKYGSRQEAARWVASPGTSAHVSGGAVDVGPAAAAAWLARRGAAYGLCRIYGNEPWHYELRPQARERGCPPTYPDPTHDPRHQP